RASKSSSTRTARSWRRRTRTRRTATRRTEARYHRGRRSRARPAPAFSPRPPGSRIGGEVMEGRHSFAGRLAHAVHRRLLWLLLGCYAGAAFWPAPGLWLRGRSLGEVTVLGERLTLSLPLALLAFLLANAALGVRAGRLCGLLRGPWMLGAGLAANLLL